MATKNAATDAGVGSADATASNEEATEAAEAAEPTSGPGDESAGDTTEDLVGEIGSILLERNLHLACAESLTGGALASAFARAKLSSDWFLGGVVAYEKRIKFDVLDVPPGPVVSARAAEDMVRGLAKLMSSDVALAITGVGGPDEQDGMPVGTVFVGVGSSGRIVVTRLDLEPRSPAEIVGDAVEQAVALLHRYLVDEAPVSR